MKRWHQARPFIGRSMTGNMCQLHAIDVVKSAPSNSSPLLLNIPISRVFAMSAQQKQKESTHPMKDYQAVRLFIGLS